MLGEICKSCDLEPEKVLRASLPARRTHEVTALRCRVRQCLTRTYARSFAPAASSLARAATPNHATPLHRERRMHRTTPQLATWALGAACAAAARPRTWIAR